MCSFFVSCCWERVGRRGTGGRRGVGRRVAYSSSSSGSLFYSVVASPTVVAAGVQIGPLTRGPLSYAASLPGFSELHVGGLSIF